MSVETDDSFRYADIAALAWNESSVLIPFETVEREHSVKVGEEKKAICEKIIQF